MYHFSVKNPNRKGKGWIRTVRGSAGAVQGWGSRNKRKERVCWRKSCPPSSAQRILRQRSGPAVLLSLTLRCQRKILRSSRRARPLLNCSWRIIVPKSGYLRRFRSKFWMRTYVIIFLGQEGFRPSYGPGAWMSFIRCISSKIFLMCLLMISIFIV